MSERPSKLPFSATRVVKASRILSWGEKAVWLEDHALDEGPEGAWIAAASLGQRLGISAETVEAYRRRLATWGLHHRIPRPGARQPGWVATLPEQCVPRSARPAVVDVERLVMFLDLHLRPDRDTGRTRTGIRVEPVQASGLSPDVHTGMGGVGGGTPSSVSQGEAPLQPYIKEEDGVGSYEPKAEDGGGKRRGDLPQETASSSGTKPASETGDESGQKAARDLSLKLIEKRVERGTLTRHQADLERRRILGL
jgi:hypothetical protein